VLKKSQSAPRLRFADRVLLLQLAVVFAVVLITAGTFAGLSYQRLGEQAESGALAVARAVASSEGVRSETAALAASPEVSLTPPSLSNGQLQRTAESARARTGALFVVITDEDGLRLAHPNEELLGKKVSTDPSVALAGGEETAQEHGTLGRSARAKVPVYAPGSSSEVVGEVSVGFSSEDVMANLAHSIIPVAIIAAISLTLGALASALMVARLRRLTLGLEPEGIARLVQDQEAVLRGVDEGVIGVSHNGTITVFNDEARRLLAPGSTADFGKVPVAQSGLPAFLTVAAQAPGEYGPAEHVLGERVVIVSARPVRLDASSDSPGGDGNRGDSNSAEGKGAGSQPLGRVIMVRDRTEVQALTRQLDAVNALGTALRAQRHEFANRLHTVAGLLDINKPGEARHYVGAVMTTGPLQYPATGLDRLTDPYLEAFIGAKSIEAHERGVLLLVGVNTLIRGRITDPQDVTAVLGNLLDNAIRAAVTGKAQKRWVEVELLDEHTSAGGTLHLVVADSGDGLLAMGGGSTSAETCKLIFTPGYSTMPAEPGIADPIAGHGVGLALVSHLASRRGGEVWVADDGASSAHGAVFCARLPGVVSPKPTAEENRLFVIRHGWWV